jgi:hypothetical protein
MVETETTRYRHLQGECSKPYRPSKHCPACANHIRAFKQFSCEINLKTWQSIDDAEFDDVRGQLDAAIAG